MRLLGPGCESDCVSRRGMTLLGPGSGDLATPRKLECSSGGGDESRIIVDDSAGSHQKSSRSGWVCGIISVWIGGIISVWVGIISSNDSSSRVAILCANACVS